MALVPAVGNLLTNTFQFQNPATDIAMNVLHYRVNTISGSIPNMVDFLTAVAGQNLTEFGNAWAEAASDQVQLVSCRVTNVFPLPRSVSVVASNVVPKPGEVVDQALPLQDSVTILKRTAVGNRWGLGRFFFVGISEGDQANGVISGNMVTKLGNTVDYVKQVRSITGAGWAATLQPVLIRGPEDNPVSVTDIINAQLSNTIIKSMKRRRPGKGI